MQAGYSLGCALNRKNGISHNKNSKQENSPARVYSEQVVGDHRDYSHSRGIVIPRVKKGGFPKVKDGELSVPNCNEKQVFKMRC